MEYTDFFKGKKITVMRVGLIGRGIGDAQYMAEAGAEVTVVDDASQTVMQPAVDALQEFSNITFKFGPYDFDDFKDADFVLVGAGAPLEEPVLLSCQEAGVQLWQSAALFAELSKVPIIGVTGTRGKSTVTEMIHHVLSFVTGENIIKGGNVRGVSNLQLLKEVKEDSLAVMELDSWQLQGFGWAGISPQIAVFTNFMEDHLNYYQAGSVSKEKALEKYFADKANIFINQDEDGVLVTTPEVFEMAKKFASGKDITLGQEVVLADSSLITEDALLSTPGEHNRLNAALAYSALKAVSLSEEEIFEGLASFPGVEGRLQYLTEINGIKVYNDNNATTPAATIAGLKALGKDKKVVLIIGGADKGIEIGQLPQVIAQHTDHVILYNGTGTEKLKEVLPEGVSLEEHDTLATCVEAAIATAVPDNVILFSPAFASFGKEFKNEYDRNDQFVSLINQYE